MKDCSIKCEHIYKTHGSAKIINDLDMTVSYGSIYGFIGENGAGKTSTLKLLTGLSRPTSGTLHVLGSQSNNELLTNQLKIGSLIDLPLLYPNMSAYQNLKLYCILRECATTEISKVLNWVNLSPDAKLKVKNYSLGMRQRLGIAMALLGSPEFVILDEPMNGLDPTGIVELRELIKRLNHENGVTFLISSHLLDELYNLATDFGFIYNGHIVNEIRKVDLAKNLRSNIYIRLNYKSENIIDTLSTLLNKHLSVPVKISTLSENEISISVEQSAINICNTIIYQKLGTFILECKTENENLEDYYLNLISLQREGK